MIREVDIAVRFNNITYLISEGFKNVFKKFKNNNTKRELNRLIEQAKEFQKIYGKSQ